jgi:hypothetical protein
LTFVVSAAQAGTLSNDNVSLSYDGLIAPLPGQPASAVIANQNMYLPVSPH